MVEIFVYFVLKSIIRKLKISLHNNMFYILRHYAELYEYLNIKMVVHTKI